MMASIVFCCSILFTHHLVVLAFQTDSISVLMPNVKPTNPETYLCTSVLVDPTQDHYVVGFTPKATMNVAHHMFLIGCGRPGSDEKVWDCGHSTKANGDFVNAPTCAESSETIYAWGRNAPSLNLPPGVAFRIGRETTSRYVVLQVHYADISFLAKNNSSDSSGAIIHYTETPQPKSAGVFLLGTGGLISGMSTVHMEVACKFNEDKIIHPFAFRTHTHSLGRVVSGYRIRRNSWTNEAEWTLIGKKNPLLPQMFYPRPQDDLTVEKGDILAARCTMVSNRTRLTVIGSTNEDEMCNFYIMYWTQVSQPQLSQRSCFSSGPPMYNWNSDENLQLDNIPNIEASTDSSD